MNRIIVLAGLMLSVGLPRGVVSQVDAVDRIGAYLSRWHETGRLHGVVLVARGDEVLFEGAFGLANREWRIPHTPDTRFDIGSISKQFTTVMVLQLVAEGRLDLDDPITDHLPQYRADTGDRITIDHLLRQTSGIPCYVRDWRPTPEEREHGEPRLLRRHLAADYLVETFLSGDLLFEPGARYYYSNSNHFLLGRIIEEITDRSLRENLQSRILDPLGLARTGLLHPGDVIPELAAGYVRIPDGVGKAPYLYHPSVYGTGAMYSTVRDLHSWNRALEQGDLLPDSLNRLLFEPYVGDADGVEHAYAVNLFTMRLQRSDDAIPYTGFSGAPDGFRADAFRFPITGHIVVILDNSEQYEHWRIGPGIYRILMGEDPEMPRELASVALAREVLGSDVENAVNRLDEMRAQADQWSDLNSLSYDLDAFATRYLAIGRGRQAVQLWRLNAALAPDSPDAWRSLGAGYERLGLDSLSRVANDRAESLGRRTEELLALLDAGEYEVLRERIRVLDPAGAGASLFSSADVGPRFGRAFQSGDLETALRIAELWSLGNPRTLGPYFSMANVFKAMGDPARAIECYRRVLELEPVGPAADRARSEIAALGGG